MTVPRIYFPHTLEPGNEIELGESESHYLRDVLRLRKGERITLFGSPQFEYAAEIAAASKQVTVRVIEKAERPARAEVRITLAQSLPKTDKMDLIVQKATELGAHRIAPFASSRSIPVLGPDKARQRRERWQKIALEASRQCRRPDVPEVAPVAAFREMLDGAADAQLKIIFWEEEQGTTIRKVMGGNAEADSIVIAIGPEGGFSPEEVEAARSCGFIPTTLGRLVLKTETASLAALAIIQYERGIFSSE
jgi:16S rRNA (uracil1498-N3)-methyltransferase